HQNIDTAELLENFGGGFLHGGLVGHIDRVSFSRIGAYRIDFIRGFLRVAFGPTHGRNTRAFPRKTDSNRVADAAAGSSNHRDLIFKSHKTRSLSSRSGGLQTADGGL